jgi:hypothetical protein
MRIGQQMTLMAAICVGVWGCGGEKVPVAVEPTAASGGANPAGATLIEPSGESTSVTLSVTAESSPSEVVLAFLNAMRDGNSTIASALLTDLAQAETTKHQWPVQPPGAPSATYQLGQPTFVDAAQTGVHVPCIWTEPDGAGGTIHFEVVWALRKLDLGWRVAGFATEIVPNKPPYFFNFEDIANLKQTQALAEAALAEATGPESTPVEVPASNPKVSDAPASSISR